MIYCSISSVYVDVRTLITEGESIVLRLSS